MKKYLIILIAFFTGLQACETAFEVNAPWKNITVVYGLLNQNESVHTIKINKAFLGEADVKDMAQIQDSSDYAEGEIGVTIELSKNGSEPDYTYSLTRYIDTTKPGGTFYSPDQVLYSFSDTLLPGYDYKLVIENLESGAKVTAETQIIEHFKFSEKNYWASSTPQVNFYHNGFYTSFDKALWKSGVNGRRYQLTVRFHYREKDLDTGIETEKELDWVFPNKKAPDLNGGDELGTEIAGEDFYKYVASKIVAVSTSNNVQRCIGVLDFIVDAAGEDFNTYLEVNEPSTGIVQERPEYSNVFDDNGNVQAGFFSARYSIIEEGGRLHTSGINGNSVTELKSGQYTSNHGFVSKVDVSTCPF